jgi:hypothetical protein
MENPNTLLKHQPATVPVTLVDAVDIHPVPAEVYGYTASTSGTPELMDNSQTQAHVCSRQIV